MNILNKIVEAEEMLSTKKLKKNLQILDVGEIEPILQEQIAALHEKYHGRTIAVYASLLFESKLLHCHSEQKWYHYEKGVWVLVERVRIKNLLLYIFEQPVEEFLRSKLLELRELASDENTNKFYLRTKYREYVEYERYLSFRTNMKIRDHYQLFADSDNLIVEQEHFDKNQYLFCVKNGVIDLSGNKPKLLKHDPEHFISKWKLDIHYDSSTDCIYWKKFLNTIFLGDQGIIDFMQKFCGLCLTGNTDHQYLFFAYGSGANGKSTFFELVSRILGDYVVRMKADILAGKETQNASEEYHKATIQNARLVVTSELSSNGRMNASFIKDLTGGEPIIARPIRSNPIKIYPTCKVVMFGNYKPKLDSLDYAITRRVLLIPFLHTFTKEQKRDMTEVMKEFMSEKEGILAWFVEGYTKLKAEGFGIPEKILAATEEYLTENNPIQRFIDDCTSLDSTYQTPFSKIHDTFKNWCRENGEIEVSAKKLSMSLQKLGFDKQVGRGNTKYIRGLRINEGLI